MCLNIILGVKLRAKTLNGQQIKQESASFNSKLFSTGP